MRKKIKWRIPSSLNKKATLMGGFTFGGEEVRP